MVMGNAKASTSGTGDKHGAHVFLFFTLKEKIRNPPGAGISDIIVMKKYFAVKVLAIIFAAIVSAPLLRAQSYRGFFDPCIMFNVANSSSEWKPSDMLAGKIMLGFTTTHGVQVAQRLFVGAGTGVLFSETNPRIPLFAEARYDFFGKHNSAANLFVSLRLGYELGLSSINGGDYWEDESNVGYADATGRSGFYYQPTIGVRIRTSRLCGINIGLSYIPTYWKVEPENYNYDDPHKLSPENITLGSLSLNIGLDF